MKSSAARGFPKSTRKGFSWPARLFRAAIAARHFHPLKSTPKSNG
jgi:hypothetical protein